MYKKFLFFCWDFLLTAIECALFLSLSVCVFVCLCLTLSAPLSISVCWYMKKRLRKVFQACREPRTSGPTGTSEAFYCIETSAYTPQPQHPTSWTTLVELSWLTPLPGVSDFSVRKGDSSCVGWCLREMEMVVQCAMWINVNSNLLRPIGGREDCREEVEAYSNIPSPPIPFFFFVYYIGSRAWDVQIV